MRQDIRRDTRGRDMDDSERERDGGGGHEDNNSTKHVSRYKLNH